MSLSVLGMCLLLICVGQLPAQLATSWSKQLHQLGVKNVHMRDSLGVSNDDTSCIVWSVADGREIRRWNRLNGSFAQTWLDDNDHVVMIKSVSKKAPLFVYWAEIGTGVITDSMALPYVSGSFEPGGDVVSSDMSADGKRLAVCLWRVVFLGDGHSTEVRNDVYIIDLKSKLLGNILQTSAHVHRRFESRDTRLTGYYAGGPTWSPSGQYNYDGTTLFDYPQKGLSVRLTNGRADVIRWGLIDAVLLARTTNFPNSTGKVCLVDVCADSTIMYLAASETYADVYAPITLSHAIGRKNDGTVSVWVLPDLSAFAGDRVRVILPQSPLRTDTLYSFQSISFPLDSMRTILLDVGDGGRPCRGPLFSLKQSGQLFFRTGMATPSDTSWSAPFAASVIARAITETVTSELATGRKSVVSARLGEDGKILVSTKSGLTLILDSSLQCREGFAGPATIVGSNWDGGDFIQTLSSRDSSWTEHDAARDFTYYLTEVTVQRVRLDDFATVATYRRTKDRDLNNEPGYVSIVDRAYSEGLAFSLSNIHWVYGSGGDLYEDSPDDSLKFSSIFKNHNWHVPLVPIGGAMNASSTNAIFMSRGFTSSGQLYRRIVSASAGTAEVTVVQDDYESASAMFIHDNAAVLDNAIVKFNPPQFIQNVRFMGPFARSIPPGYAIAWDSGMFYRFDDSGTVRDSMIGPSKRPTCIVLLSRSTIACGQTDGTFRLYGDSDFASSVQASNLNQPLSATLTVIGQPTSTTLRLRTSIKPIADESTFTLMDIAGRLVGSCVLPSSSEYTLDLRAFAGSVVSGTYLLHVRAGNESAMVLVNLLH